MNQQGPSVASGGQEVSDLKTIRMQAVSQGGDVAGLGNPKLKQVQSLQVGPETRIARTLERDIEQSEMTAHGIAQKEIVRSAQARRYIHKARAGNPAYSTSLGTQAVRQVARRRSTLHRRLGLLR